MLHRKTYDTLSDTGTVLDWKVFPEGGVIVVQDSPTVLTVWHESWGETLRALKSYNIHDSDGPQPMNTFKEAQVVAQCILVLVEKELVLVD